MHHAKVRDFNRRLTSGGAWLMSRGGRIFAHSVRTLSVDKFLKRLCSAGRLEGDGDDQLLSVN
jgi:hypothetical protein